MNSGGERLIEIRSAFRSDSDSERDSDSDYDLDHAIGSVVRYVAA